MCPVDVLDHIEKCEKSSTFSIIILYQGVVFLHLWDASKICLVRTCTITVIAAFSCSISGVIWGFLLS